MNNILNICLIISVILVTGCIEVPTSWYPDIDGDGYGDEMATVTVSTHKPDATYVANNTDCDDSNIEINPEATEINDQIDNDCDGVMNNSPFSVGDFGPAAGVIIYIENNGFNGIESSPFMSSNSISDTAEWGCYGRDVPGADSTAIGSGAQNTTDILNAGCSSEAGGLTAAELTDAYELNGFSDWYLPSELELGEWDDAHCINNNIFNCSAATNFLFFSSTEKSELEAWNFKVNTKTAPGQISLKNQLYKVIAVRSF